MKAKVKKVLLAYSGGLDTSVTITWLKENYDNCEVIAMTANVGQEDDFDFIHDKALQCGASKIYIEDLRQELITDYIYPAVRAGGKYENKYLLGTALARPLIAKRMVEIAHQEGCDAIAHGCTGKGNDQVRFELGIREFDPDMTIIAPWREWEISSREEAFDYAEAHNIPLPITRETNYSKDENLWHLSHEGLDLEDPGQKPDYEAILELGVSPKQAPDQATPITIDFEAGNPVAVNGKKLDPITLIQTLNQLGGANGIGILDLVENRLVGMKSRGVYETPGGTILFHAHEKLEELTLDRDTLHFKQILALKYSELIYNGLWFSPLRQAMQAFVDHTQSHVNGQVKLELYKGNIIDAGVTSPDSLYREELATFNEDSIYNQNDAEGFIKLFGLPQSARVKK
ncbi:argininosuccinate synthase [Aerococcus urinae]|uniref:Argininosuccinate synthase n=1 Tax=Aerococcus mictus TaxID=2976810 RepID=A0A1E9PLL0_9LACT|nr:MULTISPECIES: argininosuccinate synthase [Aerococcus]KAA9290589.1 argininosuccinate synthase [Aerococcus mictus]MBU5611016.1 argininosuccinate synthase [Aerococcus urinae]MCY3034882.1 argininosuccinate synthase [Aerococcus mictus]MCY3063336.1 argininosuccinate synthase [Aerococcus mictus]MCY3066347.1 argininosuccinate synthase [Aerococcus mictus]